MFTLPELPYAYDALEPYIDAQTMQLHHGKHHQAYIDKLNAALEGSEWAGKQIEEILQNLDRLPEEKQEVVRNNGGGHYNHSFFWKCMTPQRVEMPDALKRQIEKSFGSLEEFKETFSVAAIGRFGSGWAWLTLDTGGSMAISSTPNQDSPIMTGQKPLLALDVWEHAYYLKYQNRRPEYIENWWSVVDWRFVADQLEA